YVDGRRSTPGDIIAAEFINQGKVFRAIRYENAAGQVDYYTPEGHSMRKAFIRTPVEFARVSSKFNPHRRHPILHTIRAHKGVDYAAAKGTPVRATSDGVITAANTQRGYGKVIEIQHGSNYSTLYAHLNGYASGMKKGMAVKQGQIIGYVGMTGMATGPHLHYEFRVNGIHKDPLTVELPNSDPIHAKHKLQFLAHVSDVLEQMSHYQNVELAQASPSPLTPAEQDA
ncbi:MAG TPA: peptidoglycan DD-metalloendopeptidase family protein, partial [Gammaproteobacteria bacterium]|nr:peptidoglycan DD-metalloendopeptidase family protein [Gammaproteobacteria bacterium]